MLSSASQEPRAPTYLLQIVTPAGETVRFPAGGNVEHFFVETATQEILTTVRRRLLQLFAEPTSFWARWRHPWRRLVRRAVREYLAQEFSDLALEPAISNALGCAVLALKQHTKFIVHANG